MKYLINDEKIIKCVNSVFDNLQDNLVLKSHLNESNNQQFVIMEIERNEAFINLILRENKGVKEEVENVFKTIKEIDKINNEIAVGNAPNYAVVDKLYNEAYGNIPSIVNHLFDFSKPAYTNRVENVFNKIIEKNQEQIL